MTIKTGRKHIVEPFFALLHELKCKNLPCGSDSDPVSHCGSLGERSFPSMRKHALCLDLIPSSSAGCKDRRARKQSASCTHHLWTLHMIITPLLAARCISPISATRSLSLISTFLPYLPIFPLSSLLSSFFKPKTVTGFTRRFQKIIPDF